MPFVLPIRPVLGAWCVAPVCCQQSPTSIVTDSNVDVENLFAKGALCVSKSLDDLSTALKNGKILILRITGYALAAEIA